MRPESGTTEARVCIVDDDDAVRDSLRLLLESHDIATRDYSSADRFLRDETGDVGCLILDLHMPGMSGLELLKILRARGMTRSILIVSGRRDAMLDGEVRDAGATEILFKPFDDSTLLRLVRQALVEG